MVTLTVTWVELQSWSIRVIMGIDRYRHIKYKYAKMHFVCIFLVFTGMMT